MNLLSELVATIWRHVLLGNGDLVREPLRERPILIVRRELEGIRSIRSEFVFVVVVGPARNDSLCTSPKLLTSRRPVREKRRSEFPVENVDSVQDFDDTRNFVEPQVENRFKNGGEVVMELMTLRNPWASRVAMSGLSFG